MNLLTPAGFARLASHGAWQDKVDPTLRAPGEVSHLHYLNKLLLDVVAGRKKRVIVTMPPRHSKSETISKYFPAYYLGLYPTHEVIVVGYNLALAVQPSLAARDALATYGPALFGVGVSQTSSAKDEWKTTKGGGCKALGWQGGITGRNAKLIICDDLVSSDEAANSPTQRDALYDWFTQTLVQRFENDTKVCVVGTRWHRDDIIGRLERDNLDMDVHRRWETVRFPAIAEEGDVLGRAPGTALWPELRPLDYLEGIRQTASKATWQGAYLCSPPTSDGIADFGPEYIHAEHMVDEVPKDATIIAKGMSLDPSKGHDAKTGDRSVICMLTLTDENLVYVDVNAGFRKVDELTQISVDLAQQFRPQLFSVDICVGQDFYLYDIRRVASERGFNLPMGAFTSKAKKEVRIRTGLMPFLSTNKDLSRFRWIRSKSMKILHEEICDFPNGRRDDCVDSLAIGIRCLDKLVGAQTNELNTVN